MIFEDRPEFVDPEFPFTPEVFLSTDQMTDVEFAECVKLTNDIEIPTEEINVTGRLKIIRA